VLSPLVASSSLPVRRVLVLRPDHVGDVLLSAPAVRLLRTTLPTARITYLVGPWSAAAASGGPAVDEVRRLTFPGFTRRAKGNILAPYVTLVSCAVQLRRERYDLAVVLRADHWWGALLALAAGIPFRVGGDTAETRPSLTHACRTAPEAAWGDVALAIARLAARTAGAEPVNGLDADTLDQFTLGAAARTLADQLWIQNGLESQRVIGVHPSAGASLKSWPLVRWANLADRLIEDGFGVVLIGAPDDAGLLTAIARRMRGSAATLCGQTLEVSAALYTRCALLISVDSGAGHLAAAVGTRTVRLYGPAPAHVFGPWPPRKGQRAVMCETLACAPCGYLEAPPCGAHDTPACMLALDVDDVLKAVRTELSDG
jgi:heptosyltransferase-2/heptosyltransferase-3